MKWYLLGFIVFAGLAYGALLVTTLERQKVIQERQIAAVKEVDALRIRIKNEPDPSERARFEAQLPVERAKVSATKDELLELRPLKRMRYGLIAVIVFLLYPLFLSLQRQRPEAANGEPGIPS